MIRKELMSIVHDFDSVILSYASGFGLFFVHLLVVVIARRKDQLWQVRGMVTSLRIVLAFVMAAQLPLFYTALQFPGPVESALTAYGGQGRSWLYYIGRPATTFIGVLFGFFSDIHYTFRYTCFAVLLLAIVMDTLSEVLVSNRLDCLNSGRCPQRSVWSASLFRMYIYRDLAGIALDLYALLVEAYLLAYIGFGWTPFYSYRQLTLGDDNRLLRLKNVFSESFPDVHDRFFALEGRRLKGMGKPARRRRSETAVGSEQAQRVEPASKAQPESPTEIV